MESFFYSDNLKKTNEWYNENLGIKINDWDSSSFESRSIENPDEINSLQWKLFKKGDEYFVPSKKDFMINYTVQNLEGLIRKLKENGVTILDSIVKLTTMGNLCIFCVLKAIKLNFGNRLTTIKQQNKQNEII